MKAGFGIPNIIGLFTLSMILMMLIKNTFEMINK